MNSKKTIQVIVAVEDADGERDLIFVKVKGTPAQYSKGLFYDEAENWARSTGHTPYFSFDENDRPQAVFDLFNWETASTICVPLETRTA